MSAIILASDSLECGREMAERLAAALGYRAVGREILAEVAANQGVKPAALLRALDDPPTLLGLSRAHRARLLAFVREGTIEALLADDVVCWGLAAHLYVHGVSHVLTARVLADPSAQVDEVARTKQVSPEKARRILARRAAIRRRWSQAAFERDENDLALYDLVVKLSQIEVERAVGIIVETIADRGFQPMSYSRQLLADMAVEARARSALLKRFEDLRVRFIHGVLVVGTTTTRREEEAHAAAIRELAATVPGVDEIKVEVAVDDIREAAESLR